MTTFLWLVVHGRWHWRWHSDWRLGAGKEWYDGPIYYLNAGFLSVSLASP
jgi:hypothetical protein